MPLFWGLSPKSGRRRRCRPATSFLRPPPAGPSPHPPSGARSEAPPGSTTTPAHALRCRRSWAMKAGWQAGQRPSPPAPAPRVIRQHQAAREAASKGPCRTSWRSRAASVGARAAGRLSQIRFLPASRGRPAGKPRRVKLGAVEVGRKRIVAPKRWIRDSVEKM